MTKGQIAISGCGWVTPFGVGAPSEVLPLLRRDEPLKPCDEGYWAVADSLLSEFSELPSEVRRDKGAWMASAALVCACKQALLDPKSWNEEKVGLFLGDAMAGQRGMISFANDVRKQGPRFVSPIQFPQTVGNFISGAIARAFGIRGPMATLANGSASGLDAIREACSTLANHRCDFVLAGSVCRLSEELVVGFDQPQTAFSEGACFFVLERSEDAKKRGVKVDALIGAGRLADSNEPAEEKKSHAMADETTEIEDWTGDSLANLGCSAVAAALGVKLGLDLPITGEGRFPKPGAVRSAVLGRNDEGSGAIRLQGIRVYDGTDAENWLHLELLGD